VLSFPLELILEMLQQSIVEILSTQVSVASSRLDREYATADVQEGDIKCSTTQIKDENILFGFGLAIQTVSNGGSSRLIDDTENI
jgi:hypothetical protein